MIDPSDLTITHNATGSTVQFGVNIYNSMNIRVFYYTAVVSVNVRAYLGKTGVSTGDFLQIYSDFKRTVSYQVVTKSTDSMGNETTSFATASDVDLIFFKEDLRYLFDVEGLLEVGDAYVLAPTTTGIKRYDRFSIGGETYYIEKVVNRFVLNVPMVDVGICFRV